MTRRTAFGKILVDEGAAEVHGRHWPATRVDRRPLAAASKRSTPSRVARSASRASTLTFILLDFHGAALVDLELVGHIRRS